MDRVLTSVATTVSEFKGNPSRFVREADGNAFAVLTNNKPAFYVVPPALFEELTDLLGDIELLETVRQRRSQLEDAIEVSLADL